MKTQSPLLTIVCVSYRRYRQLPILIHAFMAQTDLRFRLIIIHDGYDPDMDTLLSRYKSDFPDHLAFFFSKDRRNDYGRSLRAQGIELADTEYLLLTNDDNYYVPIFVEEMLNAATEREADIVLCDMIHSHELPGGRLQPRYNFFPTAPRRCAIDIGCFITKTSMARKVGFRDKTHDGDATYFEDLLKVNPNPMIAKVDKVLFVHN